MVVAALVADHHFSECLRFAFKTFAYIYLSHKAKNDYVTYTQRWVRYPFANMDVVSRKIL